MSGRPQLSLKVADAAQTRLLPSPNTTDNANHRFTSQLHFESQAIIQLCFHLSLSLFIHLSSFYSSLVSSQIFPFFFPQSCVPLYFFIPNSVKWFIQFASNCVNFRKFRKIFFLFLQDGITLQKEFSISCCCLRKGEILSEVSVDKSGFVPGETMKVKVYIRNASSTHVKTTTIHFQQVRSGLWRILVPHCRATDCLESARAPRDAFHQLGRAVFA